MTAPKSKSGAVEPSAIALIEEAVHLLRAVALDAWIIYLLGAGLWILGLLFFWARTTWFVPNSAEIAWSALTLTGLYLVLKTAQAEFCGRLLAQRMNVAAPEFSWKRLRALGAIQVRHQCWGVLVLLFAAVIAIPFGWVFAYYQNLSILGIGDPEEGSPTSEAATEAKRWPGQNHLALLILWVVALAGWINLGFAFFLVPWLANRLLGIENSFGLQGWWWANSTFLASVTAMTWLALDPLIKAFYVLRIFYGRSQRTGADLRVELTRASRLRNARRSLASGALLIALIMVVGGKPLHAAEKTAPHPVAAPAAESEALNRAIDRALAQSDFQWKLRPIHPKESANGDDNGGPVQRFFRQGLEILRTMVRSIVRSFHRFNDWLGDIFPSWKSKDAEMTHHWDGMKTIRVLLYGLIGAIVILLGFVAYNLTRQRKRGVTATLVARGLTLAKPDLSDQTIEAALLPADEWLVLAREQMAKAEWRLAWRALYLATLARLAQEGLLALAKAKTNLDYERELKRRAPARTQLLSGFSQRRREFEAVWYGQTLPTEISVQQWLDEMQRGTLS